jgi:putative hydrolase of the HAD superfamily
VADAAGPVSGPTRSFRGAIFDLYGTLVHEFPREEFYGVVDEMAWRVGADAAAFRERWTATAVARQTGVFPDVAANVEAVCAELGLRPSAGELAEALAARAAMYDRWFHPREGAVETLRELKIRGYAVGLLSMCAPDTPALWFGSPLAPFVDRTVFSSEVGLRKPDPPIYELACSRLGVPATECLYCGDGSYGELTGAQRVGMTSYLIADPSVDRSRQLRLEAETWTGASVADLRDLLPLLPDPGSRG